MARITVVLIMNLSLPRIADKIAYRRGVKKSGWLIHHPGGDSGGSF
jgi:hypothetical protein